MSILDYARLAQPCQRNWLEDEKIPQEDIDYIIEACTTMPSKQNIPYYSIAYTTDREVIDTLFNAAEDPKDITQTRGENSQIRANLVMIWIDNPNFSHDPIMKSPTHEQDTIFSIGIASGAAALAGVEKGYRTGFCKCFDENKVKNILRPVTGKLYKKTHIRLMLGIGIPNPDLPIRTIAIDGTVCIARESHGEKEIPLFKI